ncbi:hypothetical protein ETAA1_08530 [Urbifossiella limnaea]|uniref:Uncharacterized protein n=1 Tax=Urbifossiella limnaea TaxID=2528023 RepID=A0A517XN71_9BACT|nr:hypothetical protein ETAA1_08530 [Urbifossiella limnaea]
MAFRESQDSVPITTRTTGSGDVWAGDAFRTTRTIPLPTGDAQNDAATESFGREGRCE